VLLFNVRKIYKSFLILKVLVCGIPVSLGKNNIRFAAGVDKAPVLYLLWRKMLEIATAEKVRILVFKEFNEKEVTDYDTLKHFGFFRADSLPSNKLAIEWDTFREYLGSLRKRYRQSLVRGQRKIDCREISIRVYKDFGGNYSRDVYRLYENVLEKVPIKLEILPIGFFVNVNSYFGPESELILFKRDEQPIGKILMMYSHDTAFAMFLGLDYDINREYDLYFNMMARVIEQAIKKKKKLLNFGQNSYQSKGRMGAKAVPLYFYLKHLNRVWDFLIRSLASVIFPKVAILRHNVFKKVTFEKRAAPKSQKGGGTGENHEDEENNFNKKE
jgi:predicted N-acyltransferase